MTYTIRKYLPNFLKNTIKFIYMKWELPWDLCKIAPLTWLIHKNFIIWKNVKSDKQISPFPVWVEIWDYCSLKDYITIYATNNFKVKIWKFCTISNWATFIAASSHNYTCLTTYSRLIKPKEFLDIWDSIELGNDIRVWKNAIIMKWVKIWTGAIIWAWAVVTKNIPPYAIVWWNPAKIIKYRFDEKTIKKLLKSEWWNWDIKKIQDNYYLEFLKQ